MGDDAFLDVQHGVAHAGHQLLVACLVVGQPDAHAAQFADVLMRGQLAHADHFHVLQLHVVAGEHQAADAGAQRGDGVGHGERLGRQQQHRQVGLQLVAQREHVLDAGARLAVLAQHQVRRAAADAVLEVLEVGDPRGPHRAAGVAQVGLDALGDFLA
jgi:hypothetical protein